MEILHSVYEGGGQEFIFSLNQFITPDDKYSCMERKHFIMVLFDELGEIYENIWTINELLGLKGQKEWFNLLFDKAFPKF